MAFRNSTVSISRIILAQLVLSLLAASVSLFFDWVVAYSMVLGGAICVLPNAFLAWRLQGGSGSPVRRLLQGEAGKFGVSIAMFVAVFVWVEPLNVVAVFAMFVALQAVPALMPLLETKASHRN